MPDASARGARKSRPMTPVLLFVLPLAGATHALADRIRETRQDDSEIRRGVEKLCSADPAERQAAEEFLRGAGARAVPELVRILEDDHSGIRDRVNELVARLSDPDWRKRDEAMRALSSLGRHAIKPLQEHENATDPEVAWRVRAALLRIQDRSAQDEKEEAARQTAAARMLGHLGDARAVPALLRAAGLPNRELRLAAVEAASLLREHLKPAQAEEVAQVALELYMHEPRVAQRAVLLKALGRLRCAAAVKPLAQLLRDRTERNTNLKRNAVSALVAIGTPDALRAVIGALEDEDVYVRHGAFLHLEALAGEGFGYDPRGADTARAVEGFRGWWERKTGLRW